ncbi:universal stress protein [Kribbella sp. NPDC003557]|uniref:universal stress protein n=1 Tax=Kribbella sp. NPDC003557 TaxID=3154449 RepID=UPI00339FA39D
MSMKDYHTIVAGTDGSGLADQVIARAAWLAVRDDADLVVVCAFSELPRRTEARNVATLGGDARLGQVLGRAAAGQALQAATVTARDEGASVAAALLVDGEPAMALLTTAEERSADLIVLGAIQDRSLIDRLLGTVATEVTKRAGCDVLIVRPTGAGGDLGVPEDAPPA